MFRSFVGAATGAVVVAVTLSSAGCSGAAPGGPSPGFPPRPADIDISRLDPCTLLSERTAAELGDDEPRPGSVVLDGAETPTCAWSSLDAPLGYNVQLIPQGAAQAIGAPGTTLGEVEGYGTVRITDREDTYPLCELLVDATDTSLIRIRTTVEDSLREDGSRRTVDDACAGVERVAPEIIRTARDQSG